MTQENADFLKISIHAPREGGDGTAATFGLMA